MMKPRLVLIEDSAYRIGAFIEWLAGSGFVLIVCRSGGQAKGVMSRGGAEAIAGIMLDHNMSATDVLPLIATKMRRGTPILIHSHNPGQAPKMHRALDAARMSVTRTRFASLTESAFLEWLQEVRDNWEDVCG